MLKRVLFTSCAIGLMSMSGCGGDSSRPASCDGPVSPGPAPIRRLTRIEYNNTIFQLLGDISRPANNFAPDEEALGFDNQAGALVVSPLLAEQYMTAAEELARNNAEKLLLQLPACSASGSVDTAACTSDSEAFIRSFGKRAFRRPLTEDEVALHKAMFEQGTALGDTDFSPQGGVELVVQAMLQSPYFLYRVEFGMPDPDDSGVVPLTSYEIASRLSYLLWNTMPDDALFKAAEQDELLTAAQIEAQARRMIETPRAREAVKNFHRQWLKLDDIEPHVRAIGKNRAIYPDYYEPVLSLMRKEAEAFFDYTIFDQEGSLETLFTAPYSMMNEELAAYYGIQNGPTGGEFVRVDLDPERYSGFLTQGGLLTLYAKPDRSSPIHRGKFVRESLLCQSPPPPPDIIPPVPTVDENQTTREQFAQHSVDPLCNGCHRLMDPLGLAFEHYDGIGRYRELEWGLPIDDRGEIIASKDADGPFTGVVELAHKLSDSRDVRECVVTQWFRYGYGRAETREDTCSVDTVRAAFADSDYNIKDLIIALTKTDAFRYRRAIAAAEVMP